MLYTARHGMKYWKDNNGAFTCCSTLLCQILKLKYDSKQLNVPWKQLALSNLYQDENNTIYEIWLVKNMGE